MPDDVLPLGDRAEVSIDRVYRDKTGAVTAVGVNGGRGLVEANDHGALISLERGHGLTEKVKLGPNHVHAMIRYGPSGQFGEPGTLRVLGISENLLTNIGRDWLAGTIGGFIPAGGAGSPATTVTATAVTATATPWTASNLGTPQLGIAGMRIYASVTGVTTPPVYGNVVSNTTSVATIDQWWTAADGVGTTPANTNGFILGAGGMASVRFMGLTTNAGAASAADTVLTGEITTNGCNRQLATYAHTYGAATFTLVKAFAVGGTFTAIHKMGLFLTVAQAGADPVIFETVLNQDATVGSGDTLTVTETVTLSG